MSNATNMPESDDVYSLLESSFRDAPILGAHKPLPRRTADFRTIFPAAAPLEAQDSFSDDDETPTEVPKFYPSSQPSPAGGSAHLPPTPPTIEQENSESADLAQPTLLNGTTIPAVMSNKSSFSTPINQRSPPTPDPSPPRTTESLRTPERPERPSLFPYPSPSHAYPSPSRAYSSTSRAESFKTAREEQSARGDSSSYLPLDDTLETRHNERSEFQDRDDESGLGLAFEYDDGDSTPTARRASSGLTMDNTYALGHEELDRSLYELPQRVDGTYDDIPNREWDTNLMRNVTVRRKPQLSRPRVLSTPKPKQLAVLDTTSSGTDSTVRRASSLRERVESSKDSPRTPSMERFAEKIGWPSEVSQALNSHLRESDSRRNSGISVSSTVVEAVVIVTPPQRRQTLRHTGKNLARRADGSPTAERSPISQSNRNSLNSDDVPLHQLVHRKQRLPDNNTQATSGAFLEQDTSSPPASAEKYRGVTKLTNGGDGDAFALRLAAQRKSKTLNRSISKPKTGRDPANHQRRMSSAPEVTSYAGKAQSPLRTFFEVTPPGSPEEDAEYVPLYTSRIAPRRVPLLDTTVASSFGSRPQDGSPTSPRLRRTKRASNRLSSLPDTSKALPAIPIAAQLQTAQALRDFIPQATPPAQAEVVNRQRDTQAESTNSLHLVKTRDDRLRPHRGSEGELQRRSTSASDTVPTIKEPPPSAPGRKDEQCPSLTRTRSSTSQDGHLRLTLDRIPAENTLHRTSISSSLHPDDRRRTSFDRSTTRTEEHAMARHLYAQSTPFSQFSDTTPELEVSEATAVSIHPHNNHSLLVIQQISRSNTLPTARNEPAQDSVHSSRRSLDTHSQAGQYEQPSLLLQPSTPPQPVGFSELGVVDSPLKNPRTAPEPPVIKFIPPTPSEEVDRQLLPGPPSHTNSLPVRRLSLRQRARRYSDTIIAPILARNPSLKARIASSGTPRDQQFTDHRVPSVNDEEGTLHPFWRPRGFWDDFEDSASDSDSEFGDMGSSRLPSGGDTSDVQEPHARTQPKPLGLGTLGRRLTNGFKGSGGFLIGNSLGMTRAGTNRRRHYGDAPVRTCTPPSRVRSPPTIPKLVVQRPTFPRKNGVRKAGSKSTLRSQSSFEDMSASKRDEWRKGKKIPGLGMHVQYIGLSGVKAKMQERREKKREKEREGRREEIRKSIGPKFLVEEARVV